MSPLPPLGFFSKPLGITNSYESIYTANVGAGGSAYVEFTSIPSTYKHLQIRAIVKNEAASNSSGWLQARANSDTASNYTYHYLSGAGSGTPTASGAGTQSAMLLGSSVNNGAGGAYSPFILDVLDYANTNKYKTFRALTGVDTNSWGEIYLTSGLWQSTSAITTLRFYTASYDIAENSQFALYGIKG